MRDPETLITLLKQMAERPNGRISMPVYLAMPEPQQKRKHHMELLHDAGLADWSEPNKHPRITNAGYDFIEAIDKKKGAREKFIEVLSTGAPLLSAVGAVAQLFG